MPLPFVDRTGRRYGRWTAIYFVGYSTRGVAKWHCICNCGTERAVLSSTLHNGSSFSCGCYRTERQFAPKNALGMAGTPTYESWHAMRQRTEGKGGHGSYPMRGIGVCKRWLSFKNFLADMGVRPTGTTLDRIKNERGYSKSNCRWATPREQSNNRSNNRIVQAFGGRMTLTQAAERAQINVNTLRGRLRRGIKLEHALSLPPMNRWNKHEILSSTTN
jgi:hypothetical protein